MKSNYNNLSKDIKKRAIKNRKKSELLKPYVEYDLKTIKNDVNKAFKKYKDSLNKNGKVKYTNEFHNAMLELACTLTCDEAKFLTYYYLDNSDNKEFRDNNLVYESCLVKTWYAIKSIA